MDEASIVVLYPYCTTMCRVLVQQVLVRSHTVKADVRCQKLRLTVNITWLLRPRHWCGVPFSHNGNQTIIYSTSTIHIFSSFSRVHSSVDPSFFRRKKKLTCHNNTYKYIKLQYWMRKVHHFTENSHALISDSEETFLDPYTPTWDKAIQRSSSN